MPQHAWHIPEHYEEWSASYGLPVDLHLGVLFCDAIRSLERTNYSMLRIAVHKHDKMTTWLQCSGSTRQRMAYFFRDRDYKLTQSGHRKPMFHFVRPYMRADGTAVKAQFRGDKEFEWAGYHVSVTVPGLDHFMMPEMDVGTVDTYWKEKGEKYLTEPEFGKQLATTSRKAPAAMSVRLTQIDGKLPNLALMKLAHYHLARGDEVHFSKHVERELFEPDYDAVYGSAIFSASAARVAVLQEQFPGAIVGGTHNLTSNHTVEDVLGIEPTEAADYSIYPRFNASIGFTQRGCRLKCGFCVVPKKEGKARTVQTIANIWRGDPYPKHLHLLDNDFFGQPREQWQARLEEIRTGGFKVCLNQGINTRMINDESAAALASIQYTNDRFDTPRLYTAWDNIGDEERFFTGVDTLERHGIPPKNLMVYMLVGYDKRETWERVLHRFNRMVEREINPYPMIYGERWRTLPVGGADHRLAKITLSNLQGWAMRRAYFKQSLWEFDYNGERDHPGRRAPNQIELPI